MADPVLSSARQLMIQVREYLLPPEATVEDVVLLWMDPITRDTANRLPFFKLKFNPDTLNKMKYLVNGSTPQGSQNYFNVYPFELTRDGYLNLYLKSIQSSWTGNYIKTQTLNFSQRARVVVYNENPLDTVTLRLLIYNTLMTPWLDMYSTLLNEASTIAAANDESITLYVPKAFSSSQLTRWEQLNCTIVDMVPGDKFQDMAILDIRLVVEQPRQITQINNFTGNQ